MNTTLISNVSNLQGLAYYTNNATSGILFTGGLIALFFVMLITLSRSEGSGYGSLAASAWSTFILGSFFWLAHLIPTSILIVFLIITVVSTFMLYVNKP